MSNTNLTKNRGWTQVLAVLLCNHVLSSQIWMQISIILCMTKHALSIQREYLNKLKFMLHAIHFVFCFVLIWLHWITGRILVKKMLPPGQKITRHNYVLSVQDWCYNTATLNVTVTQNIVSMTEGKYWGTRRSLMKKRVVCTKFNI
jgi:hypothetical protein